MTDPLLRAWAVPPRAERSWLRLGYEIDRATDDGVTLPCHDPSRARWWTSDHAEEREAATHACRRCPVANACGQYANEAGIQHHVWGAVDRTVSQRKAS